MPHAGSRRRSLILMSCLFATLALAVLLAASGSTRANSPGATERVSVDSAGNQADDNSRSPSISADGRYVAFISSNLIPGVMKVVEDVFVHDRQTGITERVSVNSAGEQVGTWITWAVISGDGRYVAFASFDENLVPGDTNNVCGPAASRNCMDVFVHDRETGVTERVSVDSAGNQGNGDSGAYGIDNWGPRHLDISADGRYVAFASWADNLVPGDTNGSGDVFVHDRQTGITQRVSVDSAGNQGEEGGWWPTISADGRYVAFQAYANFPAWGCPPCLYGVFVHDRHTGTTALVSVDSSGNKGDGDSYRPDISADGRYVAFASYASNLVPGDTNDDRDIFVHDRDADEDGIFDEQDEPGAISTERVSVDSAGNQGGYSSLPDISADGRYVAFVSWADNLVPGDTNGKTDVFVHDRQTGVTERVSVDSAGNQANGSSGDIGDRPAISSDGRYVAFYSGATDLVPGDTNRVGDVFVHDVGDSDGDGEWDPFDPDPDDPDCDDDAFDDGIEMYLGTDPRDACPDDLGDDAWPLDVNMDTYVTVAGDALNFRGRIGATPGDPMWWQRLDLNADNCITVAGDALLYRGMIGAVCTNP